MEELFYKDDLYSFETQISINRLDNGLVVVNEAGDNTQKIKFLAHPPTFDLVSSALEEATYINHITGEPFVRTSILYRNIFAKVIKVIEIIDGENTQQIPIDASKLNSINYNLVKIICKEWMRGAL